MRPVRSRFRIHSVTWFCHYLSTCLLHNSPLAPHLRFFSFVFIVFYLFLFAFDNKNRVMNRTRLIKSATWILHGSVYFMARRRSKLHGSQVRVCECSVFSQLKQSSWLLSFSFATFSDSFSLNGLRVRMTCARETMQEIMSVAMKSNTLQFLPLTCFLALFRCHSPVLLFFIFLFIIISLFYSVTTKSTVNSPANAFQINTNNIQANRDC